MIEEIPSILLILIVPGTESRTKIKVINENVINTQSFTHKLMHTNNGKIFWIVERKNRIVNEQVFKIEINHLWSGAAPSFKNILIVPTSEKYSGIKLTMILEDKKRIEATDWTRKYFIVFSKDLTPWLDIIGKKASIFNSRATHIKKEDVVPRHKIILRNKIK